MKNLKLRIVSKFDSKIVILKSIFHTLSIYLWIMFTISCSHNIFISNLNKWFSYIKLEMISYPHGILYQINLDKSDHQKKCLDKYICLSIASNTRFLCWWKLKVSITFWFECVPNTPCFMSKVTELGSPTHETQKPRRPCQSRCVTIQIPLCSGSIRAAN